MGISIVDNAILAQIANDNGQARAPNQQNKNKARDCVFCKALINNTNHISHTCVTLTLTVMIIIQKLLQLPTINYSNTSKLPVSIS